MAEMSAEVKKIYDFVQAEEDRRYEFAYKCLGKGSLIGNAMHTGEASMLTRVRYFIEMMYEQKETATCEVTESKKK